MSSKALRDIRVSLRALGDQGCLALFKKKPELRMVLNTPDQIMKKHVNDFNALTTQSLNEQEARALYAAMPQFRKDQEKQLRVRLLILRCILNCSGLRHFVPRSRPK